MQAFNTSFTIHSKERTEVTDISDLVRREVRQARISDGIALVTTLHTTCSLFINEFQPALIEDVKALLERLVPERSGFYRHNDCRVSDCERGNAHSHLRAALLGQCIMVGVNNRDLTLGRFQSVIFAELDGPRNRTISIQIVGE